MYILTNNPHYCILYGRYLIQIAGQSDLESRIISCNVSNLVMLPSEFFFENRVLFIIHLVPIDYIHCY